MNKCQLCTENGGELIIRNDLLRVVSINDKNYPGFIRIILNQHIKEMSDLNIEESSEVFKTLLLVEKTIRELYIPDKINLASLGNVVPHLHWHIIPRYKNDLHFPNPIWGNITNPDYIPDIRITDITEKFFKILSTKLR